jgi:hypothetical protein
VVVGLYLPGGDRFALLGDELDHRRYKVGELVVAEQGPPRWEPHRFVSPTDTRNPAGTLIDFGPVITDGAFRLTDHGGHLRLTPLPDAPAMQVTLRAAQCYPGRRITAIHRLDRDDQAGPPIPWTSTPGEVSLVTRPGDFAYRLTCAP